MRDGTLLLGEVDNRGEPDLSAERRRRSRPSPKPIHAPAPSPAGYGPMAMSAITTTPSENPAAATSRCGWQASEVHSTPSPLASSVGAIVIGRQCEHDPPLASTA